MYFDWFMEDIKIPLISFRPKKQLFCPPLEGALVSPISLGIQLPQFSE